MKVLLESSHKLTSVILSGFLFSQHVFSNCRYIDYMHPYIEKVNFIVDFFMMIQLVRELCGLSKPRLAFLQASRIRFRTAKCPRLSHCLQ